MVGRNADARRARGIGLALLLGLSTIFFGQSDVAAQQTEIVINIPAFRLYLYEDGVPTESYPIGVGRVLNPSQLGRTEIINEVPYPTYYPPNWYAQGLQPIPPGPDNPVGTLWLGLGFRGYGIHGTNRPETIGTAASAGCVRMHNHDVEELAKKVGVGTPVTFVYETIEAWKDPLTGWPIVRVYPDVYDQGTNTIERMEQVLADAGVLVEADRSMLESILHEAAGVPRAVPTSVGVTMDGVPVGIGAVDWGGRRLVSLDDLANFFDDRITLVGSAARRGAAVGGVSVSDAVVVGRRAYAPAYSAAQAFGIVNTADEKTGIAFERIQLSMADGEPIDVRAYPTDHWLLLPVQDIARRLGVGATWDSSLRAVMIEGRPIFGAQVIDGKAYLPHDRLAELMGVRIDWSPGETRATLRSATIRFASDGESAGTAFVFDRGLFVPLRPIASRLGQTVGWNQDSQTAFIRQTPIQGFVRLGRLYASLDALIDIFPDIHYEWLPDELELFLTLPRSIEVGAASGA